MGRRALTPLQQRSLFLRTLTAFGSSGPLGRPRGAGRAALGPQLPGADRAARRACRRGGGRPARLELQVGRLLDVIDALAGRLARGGRPRSHRLEDRTTAPAGVSAGVGAPPGLAIGTDRRGIVVGGAASTRRRGRLGWPRGPGLLLLERVGLGGRHGQGYRERRRWQRRPARGDDLDLSVADAPSTQVASPENYAFQVDGETRAGRRSARSFRVLTAPRAARADGAAVARLASSWSCDSSTRR